MPRQMKARAFVFTLNNYTEDDRVAVLNSVCKYMVVGKEVGEQGTPHLQGYIHYGTQKSVATLRGLIPRAHIEVAKGNASDNQKYCSKGGDFEERGELPPSKGARVDLVAMVQDYADGLTVKQMLAKHGGNYIRHRAHIERTGNSVLNEERSERANKRYKKAELRDWQQDVVQQLAVQNDRQILFVVDPEGNNGKSWLANYLVSLGGNKECIVYTTTKKSDCVYAYKWQSVVVFDLTRTDADYINYGCMEAFKGENVFSPKYESGVKALNYPVSVLVLMNQDPNMEKLSQDRYNIFRLD